MREELLKLATRNKLAAALNFNRLRAALGGEKPLYHMVNSNNVPSLLRSGGTLMSPAESSARGLLNSVEGSWGSARVDMTRPPNFVSLRPDGADFRAREYINAQRPNYAGGYDARPGYLLGASMPGVVGRYGQLKLQANAIGRGADAVLPAKNWPSISLSHKPARAYGDVGLMTTPRRIHGNVDRVNGAEVQAHPLWHKDATGLASHAELPRANGTLVYDPRAVTRETATDLKASGAVPLNGRFYRLQKALAKRERLRAGHIQGDSQNGNLSWDARARAFPQYDNQYTALKAQYAGQ